MTETRVHPATGALLYRDVRKQTIRVGSLSQVVEVPGWYPEDEGDAIHTGADLKISDEAFKRCANLIAQGSERCGRSSS